MTTPQIQPILTASSYAMTSASTSSINASSIKLTPKEIQAYICPISLDKFEDPVIDTCGHTFDRFWITEICRSKSKDGVNFPCPLDPSKIINITQLNKNYALADAMEETDKNEKETKSIEDRMTALENRLRTNSSTINDEIVSNKKKLSELRIETEQVRKKSEEAGEKLKEAREKSEEMYQRACAFKEKNKIRKQQLKNYNEMSLGDRIYSVFFYSHLETVKNRGLDEGDLNFLKERVILNKPS